MLKIAVVAALGVYCPCALAQFTITDVVNAGSRLSSGSQSAGIAQGAIFVATGRGIGTDFQQAAFPLPTADGLAGINVRVVSGDQSYDAPMVYVAPNEVAAILPSVTPLGPATVTVTNNGVSASRAIKVVDAAFGIFTIATNSVQAAAFNVGGDGSYLLNNSTQTVAAGQDVIINGTGLGAIASDETQPGAADVPAATVQVYVGMNPATVVSAGRGTCCDGIDPAFRIPQGVAGWDTIRFTVPDGLTGCQIPVAVQTGNFISNIATISVDPSGTQCTPLKGSLPQDYIDALKDKKGLSIGSVDITRGIAATTTPAGVFRINRNDEGTAAMLHYNNIPADTFAAATDVVMPNSCFVPPAATPIVALPVPTNLDAGPSLTISGPAGNRSIPRLTVGNFTAYDQTNNFGNATPGNWLDPGHYTLSAPGGKDIGQFSTSLDFPPGQFTWTGAPTAADFTIDRSQGLTVKWTGGTPGTLVTISGGSIPTGINPGILGQGFRCVVPVEAGEFTVPPFVLLNLPPTGTSGNVTIRGNLTVYNAFRSPFKAPGLDFGLFGTVVTYSVNPVTYK